MFILYIRGHILDAPRDLARLLEAKLRVLQEVLVNFIIIHIIIIMIIISSSSMIVIMFNRSISSSSSSSSSCSSSSSSMLYGCLFVLLCIMCLVS